jgi:site-specific DNA recombinase
MTMTDTRKRAVGYVRVSTVDQVDTGWNLAEDRKRIEAIAAANGWQLLDIYDDGGRQGDDPDRPALLAMLAALNSIDVVILRSQDRLSRDLAIWAMCSAAFRKAGVRVETFTGTLDLHSPQGEFFNDLMACVGKLEKRQTGQRVKQALKARSRQGLYSGGAAPYGYLLDDTRLVIDPAEADVIRRIFADYCSGVGQRGIVRSLNDVAVPTGHSGPWHQSHISRLLASPVYVGKITFRGEVLPGAHEPIIDQAIWNRVQVIRRGQHRTRGRRQPASGHLLTRGLLRCPSCGSGMATRKARPGVERERYVCLGRIERGPDFCDQPSIRRELIDEPFLAHLLDGYIDIEATRERIEDRASGALSAARDALREREVVATKADEALARVRRDYTTGAITAADWRELRAELEAEREAAAAALERARAPAEQLDSGAMPGDAEQALLDHLAALKAAVSGQAGAAPDLAALRNVIGDLFEYVQVVKAGELPPSGAPTGGLMPIEGDVPTPPRVDGGRYWLLTPLRLSAVDPATLKPTGQEMPVEWSGQYPDECLCRYCWW